MPAKSLPLGASRRGSILLHEPQAFQFSSLAGQLFRASARAQDVDLALCLYSSEGKLILEQDGLWSVWETETILWSSDRTETLTLTIQAVASRGKNRNYILKTERVPDPTERDRQTTRALGMLEKADLALRTKAPGYEALLTHTLRLWERLGDGEKVAEVQFRLGVLHQTTNPGQAEGQLLAALQEFASKGQTYPRAWTFQKLAELEERSGRRVESAEHLVLARQGFESLGAGPETAEVLEAQARLARLLGHSDTELQLLQSAGSLWRQLGRPEKEAEAVLYQGLVLARWGRYNEALERYGLAWSQKKAREDLRLAARIRTARGMAYARLGNAVLAQEELEPALDLWNKVGDARGSVAALSGICFALRQLGKLERAFGFCQSALQISQEYGPPGYAARTRYSVGLTLRDSGRPNEALPLFRQSREEARQLGDRDLEAASLLAEARSEHAIGNLGVARDRATQAIDVLESARLGSDVLELRTSFLGDRGGYYDLAIDLHLELADNSNREKEWRLAFETDERYRARGLLDLVVAGRKRVADTESTELRNAEASLAAALESTDQGSGDDHGLSGAWRQYSVQVRAMTAADPLRSGNLPSLPEVQKLLGPETVLLQVRLREKRSICWVITHDDLQLARLPAEGHLKELGNRALGTLASPPAFAKKNDHALERLSQELLDPLGPALRGRSRIVVVADGFLQGFPWAALLDPEPLGNGERLPLLERFEITQAPSSSLLVALAKRKRPRRPGPQKILALGNPLFAKPGEQGRGWPSLPATEAELQALRAAAGTQARVTSALGAAASRQTLLEADWPHISILHLATHAEVDGQFPYLSRLALAEKDLHGQPIDGSFFAFETLRLPLAADLVVLSGCRTAQGDTVPGEGLVGLSYAFLAAGADRVLASLWPVEDVPTADLIAAFYRHHLGAGQSEAAALSEAQRELRRHGATAYVWGSFMLQGRLSPSPREAKQIIGRRAPPRSERREWSSIPTEIRRHESNRSLPRGKSRPDANQPTN